MGIETKFMDYKAKYVLYSLTVNKEVIMVSIAEEVFWNGFQWFVITVTQR